MKLWVIEIHGESGWQSTVGVGKTIFEAQKVLDAWLKINKFDEFRIKKYVRESKNGLPIRKRIPEGRVPASVSN